MAQDYGVAVYQTVRIMPDIFRPCRIHRVDGRTIVAMDPRDRRCDIAQVMVDDLTRDEHNAFRAAWGCGPVDTETPDAYTNTSPCLLYVPLSLRLQGECALQGDEELERRFVADDLDEELFLLSQERHSQAG